MSNEAIYCKATPSGRSIIYHSDVNFSSHKLGKISLEEEHSALVIVCVIVVILCDRLICRSVNYLNIALLVISATKLEGHKAYAANGEGGAGKSTVCRLHRAHNVLNTCEEESAVLVIRLISVLPENVLTRNVTHLGIAEGGLKCPACKVARLKVTVCNLIRIVLAENCIGERLGLNINSHICVRRNNCRVLIVGYEAVNRDKTPACGSVVYHADLKASAHKLGEISLVKNHVCKVTSVIDNTNTLVVEESVSIACKLLTAFGINDRNVALKWIAATAEKEGDVSRATNGERGACKSTLVMFKNACRLVNDTREEERALLVVGKIFCPPARSVGYLTDLLTLEDPTGKIACFKAAVFYLIFAVDHNIRIVCSEE